MRFINGIEKSSPYFRILDWALALASLSWGIYSQNGWWIAGGVIGFALAWIDPGTRLRKRLSFIKTRPGNPPRGTKRQ